MKSVSLNSGGLRLNGTIIYPKVKKDKHPAVLFIQGWTGEKERSYQYASGLAELGFISFLFDARGHGKSEGDINKATTKEFLDDCIVAYDYLSKIGGVDSKNISAVGSSFGGYLAPLLSTKRKVKRIALRVPADYPNDAFDKSKMQTSGTDNPDVFTWRSQPRKPGETFALDAISKLAGDMLIIESEKDDTIPHQTIQNYINAVKDKNKLTHVVMKDAPHSIKEGKFRDEVEKILVEWFSRV